MIGLAQFSSWKKNLNKNWLAKWIPGRLIYFNHLAAAEYIKPYRYWSRASRTKNVKKKCYIKKDIKDFIWGVFNCNVVN